MAQMFAYVCSDDSLSGELLEGRHGEALRGVEAEERAGLGLAWAQGGRTLVRKQPGKRASGLDVAALVGDVRSRAVVGHVRALSEGRVPTGVLQPFRAGSWLWAQEGFGLVSEEVYGALREGVPEHLRQRLGGRALAEVMFLRAYAEMDHAWKRSAKQERWRGTAAAMAQALETSSRVLRGAEPSDELWRGAAVAARDRGLIALALGEALNVCVIEGLEPPTDQRLRERVEQVARERFRAVLLTSGPSPGAEWERLMPGQALWVEES